MKGNSNGYYEERANEVDYLYVMDFKVSTKVGRSFDITRRQGELKRKAEIDFYPEVLQSYTASHKTIFDTEQAIHAQLRSRGFQYYCDFTNECFTVDCWNILQEILEDFVSNGVIKRLS